MKAKQQYLLISAYERNIEQPEAYSTHSEAFNAMADELACQLDDITSWKLKHHFKAETLEELEGFGERFGLSKNGAWCNGNYNHDWKIVRLTVQDNQITECE